MYLVEKSMIHCFISYNTKQKCTQKHNIPIIWFVFWYSKQTFLKFVIKPKKEAKIL